MYSSPERVFWRAVDNSLQVRSVSRQVARNVDAQEPDQFLRLQTAPHAGVAGLNKYYQSGDRDVPTLVTEVIGVPESDYIRVLELESNVPGQEDPDISSFQGKWASTSTGAAGGQGQLYGQLVFGIIPLGNLTSDQRSELMKMILEKKIYNVKFDETQSIKDEGRPAYGYNVSIKTDEYIRLLQRYAEMVGIEQLKGIDASQYADAPNLEFQVVADRVSSQIIATKQQGTQAMRFHSYGMLREPLTIPSETIPLQELQEKLQALQ